jgi:hypothetical protein
VTALTGCASCENLRAALESEAGRADGRRLALRLDELHDLREAAEKRANALEATRRRTAEELSSVRVALQDCLRRSLAEAAGAVVSVPGEHPEAARWRRQAELDRRNCVLLQGELARMRTEIEDLKAGRPC